MGKVAIILLIKCQNKIIKNCCLVDNGFDHSSPNLFFSSEIIMNDALVSVIGKKKFEKLYKPKVSIYLFIEILATCVFCKGNNFEITCQLIFGLYIIKTY